jgi:hypothetical protein
MAGKAGLPAERECVERAFAEHGQFAILREAKLQVSSPSRRAAPLH